MSVVNLIVAVEDLDNFGEVVEKVKKAGMRVDSQLKTVGVVTGNIDSGKLSSLKKVSGIRVGESAEYQIAPPESDLQ